MTDTRTIHVTVNGQPYERTVEVRKTLVDFLREDLRLIGTHVGCEHGICGACTILVNGETARSCIMLAVQADGAELTTIEGLSPAPGVFHPIQEAFMEGHGLQCGFCTPGFIISTYELLQRYPHPSDEVIKDQLAGNICRCTGYQQILESVHIATRTLAPDETLAPTPAD
jgi:carbon-monoxide dehydrogenase small subunit